MKRKILKYSIICYIIFAGLILLLEKIQILVYGQDINLVEDKFCDYSDQIFFLFFIPVMYNAMKNQEKFNKLIPVICYFIFMGLFLLLYNIEKLINGSFVPSGSPIIFPYEFVYIEYSPLIFSGYIFLPLTFYCYRKSPKLFIAFAITVIIFCIFLLSACNHHIYSSNFIRFILTMPLFYGIPYFLILYYALKKTVQVNS
ncbi:MAG: hypothetical protein LBG92_06835 [Prevotellaceae bacterium]|jgi:hypothetical protein|nr:hypothetical protein [Prevotellaceae bacterium]